MTALCALPVTAVLRDMMAWQAYQIQCTKMESLRLVLIAVAKIFVVCRRMPCEMTEVKDLQLILQHGKCC